MYQIFILCMVSFMITSCKSDLDSFFSGRPSGMSMVHNKIIAGGKEEMLVLLKLPTKHHNANEKNISNWQGSLTVWWVSKKHNMLVETLAMLSKNELYTLKSWVKVRALNQSNVHNNILVEIENYIKLLRTEKEK